MTPIHDFATNRVKPSPEIQLFLLFHKTFLYLTVFPYSEAFRPKSAFVYRAGFR